MQGDSGSGEEPSDDELLKRCREGDPIAQRLMFERFSDRLIDLARRKIGPRMRRRVDGDDVIQSVFRTFFRRVELGEYADQESNQLWARLVNVTLNKTCDAARVQTAKKRNVFAEQSGDAELCMLDFLGREPSPDEATCLTEAVESLMKHLAKPEYVEIVQLTLQGVEKVDIVSEVGVTRRTVNRVLLQTRRFLESQIGEGQQGDLSSPDAERLDSEGPKSRQSEDGSESADSSK